MSRPRNVPARQHGGGAAGSGPSVAPGRGRGGRGLRDIRVDEEVEIAVNAALERFRYGEDTGEAPRGGRGRGRGRDSAASPAAGPGGLGNDKLGQRGYVRDTARGVSMLGFLFFKLSFQRWNFHLLSPEPKERLCTGCVILLV